MFPELACDELGCDEVIYTSEKITEFYKRS
jgi:hypothetical protein